MKLNRKNKLLIFGSCIAIYICYAFAFSNTLEYYTRYKMQKEAVEGTLSGTSTIGQLMAREKMLNMTLSQYSIPAQASFQNELLKELTESCRINELKITDFQQPHYSIEKGIGIHSYVFSIEGGFNGILLLVNRLENNPAMGTVKNLAFTKRKNYKTGIDFLTAEVVLQKSETIKNKN